ncbi:MAG: hypothetical protein ACOYM9_01175 [Bradymonadia bacterium]
MSTTKRLSLLALTPFILNTVGVGTALADPARFGQVSKRTLSGAFSVSTTAIDQNIERSDWREPEDDESKVSGSVDQYRFSPRFGYFVTAGLQLQVGIEYERTDRNLDDSDMEQSSSTTSLVLGTEVDIPLDDDRSFFLTGAFEAGRAIAGQYKVLAERSSGSFEGEISQSHAQIGAGFTLAVGGSSGAFVSLMASKRWVEQEVEFDDDNAYESSPKAVFHDWPHRVSLDARLGLYF